MEKKTNIIKGAIKNSLKGVDSYDSGKVLSGSEKIGIYKNLADYARKKRIQDFKSFINDPRVSNKEKMDSIRTLKDNLAGYGTDPMRTYITEQNDMTDYVKKPPLDVKQKPYVIDTSSTSNDSPVGNILLKAKKRKA